MSGAKRKSLSRWQFKELCLNQYSIVIQDSDIEFEDGLPKHTRQRPGIRRLLNAVSANNPKKYTKITCALCFGQLTPTNVNAHHIDSLEDDHPDDKALACSDCHLNGIHGHDPNWTLEQKKNENPTN